MKNFLRVTSALTAIFFTFNTIAWSAPAVDGISVPSSLFDINIPESLGSISERYAAPQPEAAGKPLIFHIQDAHSSYQAQLKIRGLLTYLNQQGVDLVFLEGADAQPDLEPELVRHFKNRDADMKVANILAEHGIFGGAELYLADAANDGKLNAYGTEDLDLYFKNIRAYQSIMLEKNTSDVFLDKTKLEISKKASIIFNKALKNFFREWMSFQDEQAELLRHLDVLQKNAKEFLNLDLSYGREQIDWPQLVRLVKLRRLEKEVDFEAAKKEARRFMEWVRSQKPQTIVLQNARAATASLNKKQTGEDLRTRLEKIHEALSPAGFTFKDYKALSKAWALLIIQDEIKSQDLMVETEKLSRMILDKLAVSAEEKKLVEEYREFLLLKKLFSLELSREEYLHFSEKYRPREILRRFAPQNDTVAVVFEKALDFYRFATERDQVIYKNMSERIQATGKKAAILITGGFHAGGLQERFKQNNFSYLEIMPHISEIKDEEHGKYMKSMLGSDPGRSHVKNLVDLLLRQGGKELLAKEFPPVAEHYVLAFDTAQAAARSEFKLRSEMRADEETQKKLPELKGRIWIPQRTAKRGWDYFMPLLFCGIFALVGFFIAPLLGPLFLPIPPKLVAARAKINPDEVAAAMKLMGEVEIILNQAMRGKLDPEENKRLAKFFVELEMMHDPDLAGLGLGEIKEKAKIIAENIIKREDALDKAQEAQMAAKVRRSELRAASPRTKVARYGVPTPVEFSGENYEILVTRNPDDVTRPYVFFARAGQEPGSPAGQPLGLTESLTVGEVRLLFVLHFPSKGQATFKISRIRSELRADQLPFPVVIRHTVAVQSNDERAAFSALHSQHPFSVELKSLDSNHTVSRRMQIADIKGPVMEFWTSELHPGERYQYNFFQEGLEAPEDVISEDVLEAMKGLAPEADKEIQGKLMVVNPHSDGLVNPVSVVDLETRKISYLLDLREAFKTPAGQFRKWMEPAQRENFIKEAWTSKIPAGKAKKKDVINALKNSRSNLSRHWNWLQNGKAVNAPALAMRNLYVRASADGFGSYNNRGMGFIFQEDFLDMPLQMIDNYMMALEIGDVEPDFKAAQAAVKMAIDAYFVTFLALLTLRAWDNGDPGENLDETGRLLDFFHSGEHWSGQRFFSSPMALLDYATAMPTIGDDAATYLSFHKKIEKLSLQRQREFHRNLLGHTARHLRSFYVQDMDIYIWNAGSENTNAVDYLGIMVSINWLLKDAARPELDAAEKRKNLDAVLQGISAEPRGLLDEKLLNKLAERPMYAPFHLQGAIQESLGLIKQNLPELLTLLQESFSGNYSVYAVRDSYQNDLLRTFLIVSLMDAQFKELSFDSYLTSDKGELKRKRMLAANKVYLRVQGGLRYSGGKLSNIYEDNFRKYILRRTKEMLSKLRSELRNEKLDLTRARGFFEAETFDVGKVFDFFKQSPRFKKMFETIVSPKEGYSLERHMSMVLEQFEKYFSVLPSPAGMSKKFWYVFLFAHDIGKADAFEAGGPELGPKLQHEFTMKVIDEIQDAFPVSPRELHLIKVLVNGDPVGSYLKPGGDLESSVQKILEMSKEAGLPLKEFWAILTLYYSVDASSYTEDAGGIKALDFLFAKDEKAGRYQLVEGGGRLKFSDAVEAKFQLLEQALFVQSLTFRSEIRTKKEEMSWEQFWVNVREAGIVLGFLGVLALIASGVVALLDSNTPVTLPRVVTPGKDDGKDDAQKKLLEALINLKPDFKNYPMEFWQEMGEFADPLAGNSSVRHEISSHIEFLQKMEDGKESRRVAGITKEVRVLEAAVKILEDRNRELHFDLLIPALKRLKVAEIKDIDEATWIIGFSDIEGKRLSISFTIVHGEASIEGGLSLGVNEIAILGPVSTRNKEYLDKIEPFFRKYSARSEMRSKKEEKNSAGIYGKLADQARSISKVLGEAHTAPAEVRKSFNFKEEKLTDIETFLSDKKLGIFSFIREMDAAREHDGKLLEKFITEPALAAEFGIMLDRYNSEKSQDGFKIEKTDVDALIYAFLAKVQYDLRPSRIEERYHGTAVLLNQYIKDTLLPVSMKEVPRKQLQIIANVHDLILKNGRLPSRGLMPAPSNAMGLLFELSPDGLQLVSSGSNARPVQVFDIEGENEITSYTGREAQFTPLGLAYVAQDWMSLQLPEKKQEIEYEPEGLGARGPISHFLFKPNSDGLFAVSDHSGSHIIMYRSGTITARRRGFDFSAHRAISPNGEYLAHISQNFDSLRLFTGMWTKIDIKFVTLKKASGHPAFSPDSGHFAFGNREGKISVRSVKTPKTEIAGFEVHTGRINDVVYFRDGKHILSSGDDGRVKLTSVTDGVVTELNTGQPVERARILPSGREIVVQYKNTGEIRIWHTEDIFPQLVRSEVRTSKTGKKINDASVIETARRAAGGTARLTLRDQDPALYARIVDEIAPEPAIEFKMDPAALAESLREWGDVLHLLVQNQKLGDGKGAVLLTTKGKKKDRIALLRAAASLLPSVISVDPATGKPSQQMLFVENGKTSMRGRVLTRDLGAETIGLASLVFQFIRTGQISREISSGRSVIASLTKEENKRLSTMLENILSTSENISEFRGVEDPAEFAQLTAAYVARVLILLDLATYLQLNAAQLKNQAQVRSEIGNFFAKRLPDAKITVRSDASFDLSLSSVSRQLNVWKAAAGQLAQSA